MATVVELPEKAQVAAIAATNTDTNEKVAELVKITKDIASGIGAYVTLVVTLASQKGATITGQTVTVVWTDAGQRTFTETKQYNGEAISFAVPKNSKYVITASDSFTTRLDGIFDHFAPTVETGTALIDTEITVTYRDAEHIESLTEFKTCVDAMKAQYDTDEDFAAAGLALLIGVELPDVWTKDNGTDTVDDPLIVVDFGEQVGEDNEPFVGATLMRKWATVNSIQFDNRNQEVAAETTAQSGLYYYGWAAPYSSSSAYAKDTNFCTYDNRLWKCATAIAAGGEEWNAAHWTAVGWLTNSITTTSSQILPFDETANYEAGSLCLYTDVERGFTGIYKCANAVEAGEWDETEWAIQVFDIAEASLAKQSLATGAALPTGYAALFRTSLNAGGTYVQNAIRYGHNNYGTSAYRQYLNSAAGVGEWWEQKHAGQVAPYNPGTTTVRGYMAGCSEELLGLVKKVKVPCYANGNTDSAQGAYTTLDKFFLPSGTNMCGSVNANEGRVFPYMVDYIVEALVDAGKTVEEYNSAAVSEVGKIYVNRISGLFYVSNGSGGYTNVTNDDRTNTTTGGLIASNRRRFSVTNHSSAVNARLRSAYRGHSGYAWNVNSFGNLNGSGHAYTAYVSVPACVIG